MADKDFKVKNGIDVAGNANIDGNLNAAKYQTSAPSSPVVGQLWVDSDAVAGVLNQNDYATKISPTFTGTVVLPSTTSIGTVSATEIGYVDGVTSAIQTQLDDKAPIASPTFTGTTTANILNVNNGTGSSQVNIASSNNYGGTGYAGFLTLTNTTAGATNPNKFIRTNSVGALEVVNSVYNAIIFSLSDSGTVTAPTFVGALSGNATTATSATTAGSTTVFGGTINADTVTNAGVIIYGGSSSGSQATTTQRTIFGGDAGYLWACRNSSSANLVLQKGASNTGNVLQTVYNATSLGNISISTTATAFNTTSDYRLKENITNIDNPILLVKKLKPSSWNWKNQPDAGIGNGFIAHELQEIIPTAVTGKKDAVNEEGDPEYQSVDHSFIVPFLTAAIQELIEKVENLENKLALLEKDQLSGN